MRSRPLRWFPCLAALSLSFALSPGAGQPVPEAGKLRGRLTPAEEQASFRIDPGLRLDLVASEPQVSSPVAMAFDEDGRLFVVEMLDYPNGPPPGRPGAGRIRLLEDADGDGRYERSGVFADGLLFANGLLPWRGGLVVTAAPHVLYLKDTDGDGKSDRREVLYEGFAAENPQLRVSHPNLGLDGWVYVANGLRGGQVRKAGDPKAEPVNLSGKDFRFDLVSGRYEAISGMGQYGNTFDDWGERFVCDNRHHLRHVVLEDRYLARNPYLAVREVLEDPSVLEGGPLSSGGKVYPLSDNWTTSNLHAGRFTAACGVFVYRGDLLPKEYRGSAFTCDPTGNLVHREVLEPAGGSFRSRPAREGVEFLATPNDWARPVFLSDGPDGAVYLVDMYRAVIEHPQFMPPELQNRPDLTLGREAGRIWRIVPRGYKYTPVRPRLSRAGVGELVALLEHPGAWWRTTAHRLLLERRDASAVPPLRQLVESSPSPQAKVSAAWLLQSLQALRADDVATLLADGHPRVREQGVLLAEGRLKESPPLQERVLALAADADAGVRFQAALSLGEWDDARTVPALARIATAGAGDRWTRAAVASSVPGRAGELIGELLKSDTRLTARETFGRKALLEELAQVVGARGDAAEVAATLQSLARLRAANPVPWQLAGLDGLARGMGRRGNSLGRFLAALPADQAELAQQVGGLLTRASQIAGDPSRGLPERLLAVRLVAQLPWGEARPTLARLLEGDPEQQVRLAAVESLSAYREPDVAAVLLGGWRSYTPALRQEVTEVLTSRPERAAALLDAVQGGRVRAGDIDPARTKQLMGHKDAALRARAAELLKSNLPADRREVLARYRPALSQPGDPARGKAVFQKNCATCHRIGDVGVDVGPVISDTRTKTKEALLAAILNPNEAIDNNYVNYTVATKDGKLLTGILVSETGSSVTLKRAEAQTDVVLRQDIDEIISSGVSLMPDGLEKGISVAEMADLLDFLKNWRYLDGSVPLGPGTGQN